MGLKDKITQAFTQGQSDVLPQVLADCPDKTAPGKKPKKRLSEQTARFISAAASFALLIGAVFGGVAYFRDAFPTGFIHNGEPTDGLGNSVDSPQLQSPSESDYIVPIETDPHLDRIDPDVDPIIDYPNTEEGYLIRTENILYPYLDAVYDVPDAPVEYVVEYGIQKCRIVRNDRGYCIQFDFDITTGLLLSVDLLDCECEKTGVLSPYLACWIARLDAAPEYYGETQYRSYDYTLLNNNVYEIVISDPVPCIYYVDAQTGTIVERMFLDTEEHIPALQARDNALHLYGMELALVRALKVNQEGDVYIVYYECGKYAYEITVSAVDGSIVYDSGAQLIGLPKWEALSLPLSWEKARDLALSECGRDLFGMLDFTISFSDDANGQAYWLEMRFEDDLFSFRLDATTGEFLEFPSYSDPTELPDGVISEDMALISAICSNGLEEKYAAGIVTDVAVKLDTRNDPPVYWVYFKVYETVYFEVCIQGYTGQMLSCDTFENDVIATEAEAIEAARRYASTEGELMGSVFLSAGNHQNFYLVWFRSSGATVYVMVDSITLRCMDTGMEFPADAISQKDAVSNVFEYLGITDWESSFLILKGVCNDGSPYYCIILHETESERFIVVDGSNGNITSDISISKDMQH